jgi:hypothetical protein
MADLITVPTFTYNQGRPGDKSFESPIQIEFYNGTITLCQDGGYDVQERINIHPEHFEKLVKEIRKHLPEAKAWLDRNAK